MVCVLLLPIYTHRLFPTFSNCNTFATYSMKSSPHSYANLVGVNFIFSAIQTKLFNLGHSSMKTIPNYHPNHILTYALCLLLETPQTIDPESTFHIHHYDAQLSYHISSATELPKHCLSPRGHATSKHVNHQCNCLPSTTPTAIQVNKHRINLVFTRVDALKMHFGDSCEVALHVEVFGLTISVLFTVFTAPTH